MFALLRYSMMRLLMLISVGGVGYLVGLRGVFLALIAFLVSGVLSLFLLDRQRDALGASVAGVFSKLNARIDASARAEDVD